MSNELYLLISYFVIGVICFCSGITVFILLKQSYTRIADLIPNHHFSLLLKKLFFMGILLPAMLGFFSVSFKSCSADTYQKVIEKRAYLIEKNQEQVSSSLNYTAIALLSWGMIVFGIILSLKKTDKSRN